MAIGQHIYMSQATAVRCVPSVMTVNAAHTRGSLGPYVSQPIIVPYLEESTFRLFDKAITLAERMSASVTASLPSCPITEGILSYVMNTPPPHPFQKDIFHSNQDNVSLQVPGAADRLGLRRQFISPSHIPRPNQIPAPSPSTPQNKRQNITKPPGSRAASVNESRAPSVQPASSENIQEANAKLLLQAVAGPPNNTVYSFAASSAPPVKSSPSPSSLHPHAAVPEHLSPRPSAQGSPSPHAQVQSPAASPYPTFALTSTSTFPNPTSASAVSSKITKENLPAVALQIYQLLRERAQNPHGLASCAALHPYICNSIASQVYAKPDWVHKSHVVACTEHMYDFGRSRNPEDRGAVEVSQVIGERCVRVGKRKHKSWMGCEAAEERDGRVMLKFSPSEDIPLAVVLDSQHEMVYPWLRYDQSTRQYSVNRLPIPNSAPPTCVETVTFGLGENIGIPVRLTAEGMWTVYNGHELLFCGDVGNGNLHSEEVALQLTWPGYPPAYPKIVLPHSCSRQEFARLICTEILVWGTILSKTSPSQGCQRWHLQNPAFMESLWVLAANKSDSGVWAVELHLS